MASNRLGMLVRSLSTSSISSQKVKPPLQLFGTDGRYATALFSAASKQKKLDAVEKELVKFQSTMKADTKLREFILNPSINRNVKGAAMKSVASKLSLTPASTNLLLLLAENGRLKHIEGIINSFRSIMSAYRGEITCEVITARELEAAQRKQLEDVLKSFLKGNQVLQLKAKVDPGIIGGMIVSIGDRYVDMSVASKIKKYTDIISAAV